MEEDPRPRPASPLDTHWPDSPLPPRHHCVCREIASQAPQDGAPHSRWLRTGIALVAWSIVVTAILATILK
jgi:hypothetical protein